MFDSSKALPNLLRRRALDCPDRIFLETVDGGSFTYRDVWAASTSWASAFAGFGIGSDEQVAILLPTCPEALFAWIGASLIRARQVPINTAYRGNLLAHVLTNSQARILVTTSAFLSRLREIDFAATAVEAVVVLGAVEDASDERLPIVSETVFFRGATDIQPTPVLGHDVASITYTSGTTGASKGVIVYWAQLYESTRNPLQYGVGESDVHYSPLPLFHVSGQMPIYLMALANGRVVLRDGFSTSAFLSDIRRHKCTIAVVLEAMASFLLALPEHDDDSDIPLVYAMTAPIPANVDRFRKRFGVNVCTGYNMTEIGSSLDGGPFVVDGSFAKNFCGRPKSPYQCRVVDEHDLDVGANQLGELIVRSDEPWTLNGGYFNDPTATARAWRNGWFHTGDGFTRDDEGNFYFVSRIKDAIRRRGENISAQEVEAEMLAHEAIAAAAVVAVPSEHGEDEVKAFIVTRGGVILDPEDLTEFLRARLPHFMIPRFIETIDEMPITPTNKIQKQVLRDRGNSAATWDRIAAGVVVGRGA